jgi:hypothetical protein
MSLLLLFNSNQSDVTVDATGITAVASTTTHAASGADVSVSGYITGETVALTASPTGTNYQWSLAAPSGSNSARLRFAGDDTSTASFTPDVPGIYAVAVVVDGTTYMLRLSVTQLAASTVLEALRLTPVPDSQIAAPAVGHALYFSATQNTLALKNAAGAVFSVNLTAV